MKRFAFIMCFILSLSVILSSCAVPAVWKAEPIDLDGAPSNPDTPDEPDIPTEPDVPDEPDTPDEPDVPTEPDVPDEPDVPTEPDVPDEPDVPTEPDTPDVDVMADGTKFTHANDVVYTTSNLNLRDSWSTSGKKIKTVNKGTALYRTGIGSNGWDRIELSDGTVVYASADYLTDQRPAPTVKKVTVAKNDMLSIPETKAVITNGGSFNLSTELLSDINTFASSRTDGFGFVMLDLESGISVGYNGGHRGVTATGASLAQALYLFSMADRAEAPLSLNEKILYKMEGGKGILANAQFGDEFTVYALIENMLKTGDSVSFDMLSQSFGSYDATSFEGLSSLSEITDTQPYSAFTGYETATLIRSVYSYIHSGKNGSTLADMMKSEGIFSDATGLFCYRASDGDESAIVYDYRPYAVISFGAGDEDASTELARICSRIASELEKSLL